jgi:hypothetical protein
MVDHSAIIRKYPNRVPVILLPQGDLTIDKTKFLIPKEYTFGQFVSYIVKHHVKGSDSKKAIYFFTKQNVLVPVTKTMSEIFDEHRYVDNTLPLNVREENTFG